MQEQEEYCLPKISGLNFGDMSIKEELTEEEIKILEKLFERRNSEDLRTFVISYDEISSIIGKSGKELEEYVENTFKFLLSVSVFEETKEEYSCYKIFSVARNNIEKRELRFTLAQGLSTDALGRY